MLDRHSASLGSAFSDHGGAIDVACRLFPNAPRPWLDLSTGINPVAYPVGLLPAETWERLPAGSDIAALENAAARRYGVPPTAAVVAAPGTQALIQRLPVLCKGSDVRLLGRTYGEFERVFRFFGRTVRTVPTLEAAAGADVVVVVNPNNPDGRLVAPQDLLALSERVGMLIVDEAFVDALPMIHSVVPRLASGRIVVLRSFGKMYGLAGLRLGFAILSQQRAETVRRFIGPWAVSGPASAIGLRALADEAWLAATRGRLAEDGERLMSRLRAVGAKLIGGTPLFRLVAHPAAPLLFATLADAGILTRPFAGEPGWLRFGFPGSEGDWARLDAVLVHFGRQT